MPIEEKKKRATCVIDNSKNLKHLQQEVEDFVGGMLGGTETRISVTYDDAGNAINFVVDDMNDDGIVDSCADLFLGPFNGFNPIHNGRGNCLFADFSVHKLTVKEWASDEGGGHMGMRSPYNVQSANFYK